MDILDTLRSDIQALAQVFLGKGLPLLPEHREWLVDISMGYFRKSIPWRRPITPKKPTEASFCMFMYAVDSYVAGVNENDPPESIHECVNACLYFAKINEP